jgi:hypothetical protein
MTLDRQPAAAADRRPRERAINTITPMRTMAPRRIHSQTRPVLDPLAAAGRLLGCVVRAGVAELGVTDAEVVGLGDALWLGDELALLPDDELVLLPGDELVLLPDGELTLRVGEKLAIAFLAALPHPAAIHPATRIAAGRARLLVKRRMPDPSAPL